MINFLKAKNYQSHRDTRLDFVPGVNVLVGLSQSGKTAISQRAVKLLRANRPLGASKFFPRSLDKGETEVTMGLSEGGEVSIRKKISRNKEGEPLVRSSTYVLDGKEYEGFKDKVPDEVERTLNLSGLNFREQFDGPFLINSPSSEVAKTFNRVINLEETDKYKSDLTKKVDGGNAEIRILKEQLKGKKNELSQYDDLPDVEKMVEGAERLQGRIKSVEGEWNSIAVILDECDEISEEREKWEKVFEIEDLVNKAIEIQAQVEGREEDIERLGSLILQVNLCDANIGEYSQVLSIEGLVDEARRLRKESDSMGSELNRVGQIVGDFMAADWKLVEIEERKEELVDGYAKMLIDLQRCPTCFSSIGEEDVKRIVEAL